MWLRDHAATTLACVYVVMSGALLVLWMRSSAPDTMTHKKIINASVIYSLGALAWPFVWSAVCGHALGKSMPWTGYVGLIWPPLLLLLDVAFVQHQMGEDPGKTTYGMQMDGNTLSGLALTMGGLLVKYVSDNFATAAGPMLMATVLLVLLLIMPHSPAHMHSLHANTLRSAQKVALQYCLGFSITAIAIAFGVGMLHAPKQGLALQQAVQKAKLK